MANEEFEREKLCYVQNFEQARSLNNQMNRVPVLSMTLTGGLWFGAALTENVDDVIQFALLLFAGICNIALFLAAFRIRDVMQSYLEKVRQFHEPMYVTGRPKKPKLGKFGNYGMISIYCTLMLIAAALSFFVAFVFYWPFPISNVIGGLVIFPILMFLAYWLFIRR